MALTLITFAIGITLILMLSGFKSDTRRNLKVINYQIKKLQKQLEGTDTETSKEVRLEQKRIIQPIAEKKPKESLQVSGQKHLPKSVSDKLSEDGKQALTPPKETKPKIEVLKKESLAETTSAKKEKQAVEPQQKTAVESKKAQKKKPVQETKKERDYEKLIGENWLNKIGIAILVIGVGFFVKYAIDKNWIGELGRVGIGMLVGGVLIGIAHFLRKKYRAFSSVLIGGGISVFYYTISIAYHHYDVFSQSAAFGIMIGITILSTILAVIYDRKELAIIALIGGFTSPFMVQGEHANYIAFFTYIAILNSGFLALSYFKKWNILNRLALGFTTLFFGFWMFAEDVSVAPLSKWAMIFSTIYFVQFIAMNLVHNLRTATAFSAYEFVQLLSVTALYYGGMMYLLNDLSNGDFQGAFSLSMACVFLIIGILIKKLGAADSQLFKLLIGKVVAFVTLSVLVLFEGDFATYFWAIEAVLLLWLARKSKMSTLRGASVLVLGLTLFSLLTDWLTYYGLGTTQLPLIFNKAFSTSMVVLLATTAYYFLLGKEKKETKFLGMTTDSFRMLLGGLLLLLTYVSTLFELIEQIDRLNYQSEQTLILLTYHLLLVFGGMLVARIRKLELLMQVFFFFGIIGCIVFAAIGHPNNLTLRNDLLAGAGNTTVYFGHYVLTALMLGILWLMRISDRFITKTTTVRSGILIGLSLMGIFILSAELDHFAVHQFASDKADISRVLHHTQGGGYTVLWGIYSFILMVYGMRKKERIIRIFSLAVFGVVLIKLFAFDIRSISEGGKIVAFISLGVLLLVISFLYQKLKNLIVDGSFEGETTAKPSLDIQSESK